MDPILVITNDITIEDLINSLPASVSYLMKKGIKCLACGEPIWGTLGEAAREKGFSDEEIDRFVADLKALSDGER
jgi:hypothetical protein